MSIRTGIFFALLTLLSVSSNPVLAQVKFGVKTGWSISNILTSKNQAAIVNGSSQTFKNFPKTGFTGGLFFTIPVYKGFQFQPELNYSNQGAEGTPTQRYSYTVDESYRLNYLNLPLLVKYKWDFGVFAETGPQLSWLLKGKIHETVVGNDHTQFYDLKSAYAGNDFSWVIGGGYLSPVNLGLDVRYNLGLSDINKASAAQLANAPIQGGRTRNGVFQLTVFYVFGKNALHPAGSPATSE